MFNMNNLVNVFGEEAYEMFLDYAQQLIDEQKVLKYSLKKYRKFNPTSVNIFAIKRYITGMYCEDLNEDEKTLINLVEEIFENIIKNRAEMKAAEEEAAESTEETEEEEERVTDRYSEEDAYFIDEVLTVDGYDPSLLDNEEIIEEDKKMDNNINDVSSNIFFFTDRGQMELNKIRVKGVHANEFLVGSITDDARNLMLEMKSMNHEFNQSDFITMGYLIEEALKSYSRFYEYCQYIYGIGAVEGDFNDFLYQMRLSIELGEMTVEEFVA